MKQQELNADISRVKLFAVELNFLPKEYFVIFQKISLKSLSTSRSLNRILFKQFAPLLLKDIVERHKYNSKEDKF